MGIEYEQAKRIGLLGVIVVTLIWLLISVIGVVNYFDGKVPLDNILLGIPITSVLPLVVFVLYKYWFDNHKAEG